jgi:hypothetical protein
MALSRGDIWARAVAAAAAVAGVRFPECKRWQQAKTT